MVQRDDPDLDRQGWLLLAFDLAVLAVVVWIVGMMLGSSLAAYGAVVLLAGGALAVVAAFGAGRHAPRGPSGTSGARTAPG